MNFALAGEQAGGAEALGGHLLSHLPAQLEALTKARLFPPK